MEVPDDEIQRIFARLADGGEVFMHLGDYGFSTRFGWVGDRHGVTWQLNEQHAARSGEADPAAHASGQPVGRPAASRDDSVSGAHQTPKTTAARSERTGPWLVAGAGFEPATFGL